MLKLITYYLSELLKDMSISKTNAARFLDNLGINYTLHQVEVGESHLSAVEAAAKLGVLPENVYKTLVARGDKNGVFMACITSDHELDLKKSAKATKNKSVNMVALKEVLPLTGYVRGGCSPLAARKNYPVFIDEHAILQEYIFINAGQRGMQIRLKPDDLIKATQGNYADLVK